MKNLQEMKVSEQIVYWMDRGYWPIIRHNKGDYMIVSTWANKERGFVRYSGWKITLGLAKSDIGCNIGALQEIDSIKCEVVDVLHPSEFMGSEMLEVGTEVIVVDGRGTDLSTGDIVTIKQVDDDGAPYLVEIKDGYLEWVNSHNIKPYFKKESDEIQKAIEVLTKAGKIQDGKIINIS